MLWVSKCSPKVHNLNEVACRNWYDRTRNFSIGDKSHGHMKLSLMDKCPTKHTDLYE